MRVLSVVGFLFFAVAIVQAGLIRRDADDDDDDDEAVASEELYVEDDSGTLVEITDDEEDDETIAESIILLPSRVFFHLFTNSNPRSSQQLYIGDTATLEDSYWDSSKPTRIITHGWVNSHNSDACTLIRNAYLDHDDYNIILVDWSKISKRAYRFATRRVGIVADFIALFIDFLETQGLDTAELVVIGHSLGAHIAGLSARASTNTVGYVVGLDPALPYFWFSGPGSRISDSDATYVQIIHTNAGGLGYSSAIGHIDFYPNGGSSQSGCILDITGSCAHSRAYKYFAESINSETGFYAQQCETWRKFKKGKCSSDTTAVMGGSTLTTTTETGTYYLKTRSSSPYASGAL